MRRIWKIATLVAATCLVTMVSGAEEVATEVLGLGVSKDTKRTEIPKECPKKDPMNTTIHLAHEWDCTKFYKCDHGKRVLFDCPLRDNKSNRLHFNPSKQVCDWPKNAGCIQGTPSTSGAHSTQSTTRQSPTWPDISAETSSKRTIDESSITSIGTSSDPTQTPTTIRTTWHDISTESSGERTTTESSSTSKEISTDPTKTPKTVRTTWPDTSTESSNEHTTTESSPTREEISTDPTKTPTTVRTTWHDISTESSGERTTTESSPTSKEISTDPTKTPTTVRTTWPDTSTESSNEHTTTESSPTREEISTDPTKTPTTIRTTWHDISTESSDERTTTEFSPTSKEISTDPTKTPTTVRTTWPGISTESSSRHTTTESSSTSKEASTDLTTKPTTARTTQPDVSTESSSEHTTIKSSSTSKGTSSDPTKTPTTVRTTWPDTSTESSNEHTTTESSPTREEISTDPTKTPTTVRTTWHDISTESSGERTTTESSPTSKEISTDPTKTPTTVRTTWPDTSTESSSRQTTTETSTDLTSVKSTWPDTSTVSSAKPSTDNTTPLPTDDVGQPNTPTPSGNYIPHESNCSLFYEVINGNKVLKKCPAGLHFSPTLLHCVSPADAHCESTTIPDETTTPSAPKCGLPCGNIGHGSLVTHECMCDRYYRCSNGDMILHQCPRGLHFNPNIYSCDYPNSAGCLVTTTEPSTDQPTTGITIPTQCPPENSGRTIQFPHPTNCSLFYKCDNGEKQLLQCPNNLHFNPVAQMCDWPESAGCTATTIHPDNTEPTTEPIVGNSENPTEHYSRDTSAGSATNILPNECPLDNSGPVVQLPHPHNCSLFYVCDNGEKIVQSCPPGLEFNPNKIVCDWPKWSGCTSNTWSSENTKKSTRPLRITTDYTTTNTVIPTECPNDNTGDTVQLSYPFNCSLFYKCDAGRKLLQACPIGLEFNAAKQVCDWPELAGCVVSTTETTFSTASIETSKDSAQSSNTSPDESKSTDASSGSSTTIIQTRSPKTTINWITTSASSKVGSTRLITSNPTFECPSNADGLQIPHEANCSLYYECEGAKKILKECKSGLHFSPALGLCVWAANAGCESNDISSDSSSTVAKGFSDQESSPSSSFTTAESGTTKHTVTPAPGSESCIGTCPSKDPVDYTVLLPNVDCTKFCMCSNSRAYVYNCPAELHFNPTKNVCDYPREAECLGEGGYGRTKFEAIHAYA